MNMFFIATNLLRSRECRRTRECRSTEGNGACCMIADARLNGRSCQRKHQEIMPNIVISLASADFRVFARHMCFSEHFSHHTHTSCHMSNSTAHPTHVIWHTSHVTRHTSQVRGEGLTQLYELMARLGDRYFRTCTCAYI